MLPGKSGFDICRAIRAQSDVPILLVTAKKEDIDKIKGLGLGADDYIVKPFSPAELTARIKAHMQIRLLLFLAGNPDIVFTRERIFDHVWGTEAVGDMSTVTVHINKLREKIEDDPSDPQYTQTVWGVGYRFKK